MQSNWHEVSLLDISDRIGDGLHGTPTYSENGDYYFVNGNNLESGEITIKDSTKKVDFEQYQKHKKDINDNALLVSINGTIGNVALYNGEEVVLGKSACYINLKKNIHREFVAYVLSSRQFQEHIQRCATGSTIKNVSLKMMREFKFRMPENEKDQIRAVESLKYIDEKIRINHQINQTLEQMAQALFKSWFVDFDPVIDNALAAGTNVSDFPDTLQHRAEQRKQAQQLAASPETKSKPLPEDIRKLFPSEFEQRNEPSIRLSGWIPKGWNIKALSDLLEVKYGKDHKNLNEGIYPVYGSGGLMRNAEEFLYEGESVLIPRKGTLTNIMYVNEKFWTVDTMFYTIPKLDNVAKFIFYHLKTLDFTAMNVGSAVPSMTTKVLNALQIITPSPELLQKFDEFIGINNQKVVSNLSNTKQLEKLRDTLLPKLISGEISIPESKVSMEA